MTRAQAYSRSDQSVITLLTVKLLMHGCSSLKEKRSHLQPLIAHLRKQFNIAVAETGLQDYWQSSILSCVLVSNDAQHNARSTSEILNFIAGHYPDLEIEENHSEIR